MEDHGPVYQVHYIAHTAEVTSNQINTTISDFVYYKILSDILHVDVGGVAWHGVCVLMI